MTTYNYEEIKAPTFTINDRGMSAKRLIRLYEWGLVDDFLADFLGTQYQAGDQVGRISTVTFPGYDHLHLKSVTVRPFNDDLGGENSYGVAVCDGGAEIELLYETISYDTKQEDSDDPETYLTHDVDVQQQMMTYGNSSLKWEHGTDTQVPSDILPGFPMTIVNHTLTWHFVPNPPLDRWYSLVGKCNDSTFLSHDAETVLFAGVNVTRQTNYDGSYKSEVRMTFQARIVDGTLESGAGDAIGWNHFLRQDGKWDRILDKQGNKLIPTTDFSDIFRYA